MIICFFAEFSIKPNKYTARPKSSPVLVPTKYRRSLRLERNVFFRIEFLPKDPLSARIRPISLWENRDQAWFEVVKSIRKLL